MAVVEAEEAVDSAEEAVVVVAVAVVLEVAVVVVEIEAALEVEEVVAEIEAVSEVVVVPAEEVVHAEVNLFKLFKLRNVEHFNKLIYFLNKVEEEVVEEAQVEQLKKSQ